MSVESADLEQALASGAAPEVLVPCDTAGLGEIALTLREHAAVLEQAAGSLGRVEVTSWRGDASTRFTDTIAVEPGRWLTAADGFIAGAVALEGFLTGMPAARDKARTATALYQQYKTLVAAVTPAQPPGQPPPLPDTGNGSVRDRIALGARLAQLTTATGDAAALAGQADTVRRQAIDLLAAARAAVTAGGDIAAHALDQAAATAPQSRRFYEANIRPAGIIGAGHTTLDFAGMIPVLGAAPDAINATWYGSAGDTTNAAVSAAGMLPLLGDAIIGGRVIRGGVEAADAMAQRALRRLDDGGLLGHELLPGSHALRNHSGLSLEGLEARIRNEGLPVASTFASDAEAQMYTYAALDAHRLDASTWVGSGAGKKFTLRTHFDHPVGISLFAADKSPVDAWNVITVLRRDPSMPNGYRIITSFPDTR